MGRKLSPLEIEAFAIEHPSLSGEKRNVSSSFSLIIQTQITEALGLPVTALSDSSSSRNVFLEAASEAQTAELSMSRDCLDLIEAYSRILDPEERQRLLKIVRNAADPDTK